MSIPGSSPPTRRQKSISVLIFLASLAFSVAIFLLPIDPQKIGLVGYGGVFLITLLGATTIFLPGPTMIAAFFVGAALNPLLVSLSAGLGSAIGETTGYTAGYATRALIRDPGETARWYWKVLGWMTRYPFLTLFAMSAIPNPITDLSGLIAGRIRYPYWRFLLATFLGKTIRFGLSAYLGSVFGRQIIGH